MIIFYIQFSLSVLTYLLYHIERFFVIILFGARQGGNAFEQIRVPKGTMLFLDLHFENGDRALNDSEPLGYKTGVLVKIKLRFSFSDLFFWAPVFKMLHAWTKLSSLRKT